MFPKYFKLIDHDNLVSVLMIADMTALEEVERLCRAACRDCNHTDLLGHCLEIKQATKEDWIGSHG